MDTVTVYIGEIVVSKNGRTHDDRRQVEFTAEELGSASAPDHDDTRGTEWTLYKLEDGQLLVHTRHWSRWQGEPDSYSLERVAETELGPSGSYWRLGEACGYGRPLTLEEALRVQETGEVTAEQASEELDDWLDDEMLKVARVITPDEEAAIEDAELQRALDEDAAEWHKERE